MIHIVFWLFMFTLGGGLIHAWLNARKTRQLREQGTTTSYSIPRIYQTCEDNREASIGVRGPSGWNARAERTAAGIKHDEAEPYDATGRAA
jgi:hypothetical protein